MIEKLKNFLRKYWYVHAIVTTALLIANIAFTCCSCHDPTTPCICGHTNNYHAKDYYSTCARCDCQHYTGKKD